MKTKMIMNTFLTVRGQFSRERPCTVEKKLNKKSRQATLIYKQPLPFSLVLLFVRTPGNLYHGKKVSSQFV